MRVCGIALRDEDLEDLEDLEGFEIRVCGIPLRSECYEPRTRARDLDEVTGVIVVIVPSILVCNTIKLRRPNIPCKLLPPVISWLYPTLITPKDCIPLFRSLVLVFKSLVHSLLLICCRNRWFHSS